MLYESNYARLFHHVIVVRTAKSGLLPIQEAAFCVRLGGVGEEI